MTSIFSNIDPVNTTRRLSGHPLAQPQSEYCTGIQRPGRSQSTLQADRERRLHTAIPLRMYARPAKTERTERSGRFTHLQLSAADDWFLLPSDIRSIHRLNHLRTPSPPLRTLPSSTTFLLLQQPSQPPQPPQHSTIFTIFINLTASTNSPDPVRVLQSPSPSDMAPLRGAQSGGGSAKRSHDAASDANNTTVSIKKVPPYDPGLESPPRSVTASKGMGCSGAR